MKRTRTILIAALSGAPLALGMCAVALHLVAASGTGAGAPPSVASRPGPARTTPTAAVDGPTAAATATPAGADQAIPAATAVATATGPPPTAATTPRPAPVRTRAPATPRPATPTPRSGPWFGVLQASGQHSGEEVAAGVTVGELELDWSAYEPQPGVFDGGYVVAQQQRLAAMRAAGQSVTLGLGLQYPPAWVFNLDGNTRFVDQYGDVWHGDLSQDVANAVFDQAVRAAEAAYIAAVGRDLGAGVDAVRAGGLLQGELRYPPATVPAFLGTHSNCYWAFDGNAQAGSPVPGWRPGQAGSASASAFLDYYLGSLASFEHWLLGVDRSAFPGALLEVLMPSWGIRPGDVAAAVATDLDGSSPAAQWGTLEMGLDWPRQIAAVPDAHVAVESTWMERADDGPGPTQLAPAHYLVTLAAPRGMGVLGENADAGDGTADLQAIVQRTRAWGLIGLMWLDEPALWNGPTSLAAYSAAIGR